MFKFDNAFLTVGKKVGIQFIDNSIKSVDGDSRKATLYIDHKGQLKADCSVVPLRQPEFLHLVKEYNRRSAWYAPKQKEVQH